MSKKKPAVSGRTTIGKVLHYLRKYTAWMALSLLCAAGSVVLTLLAPILVGRAIDCIVGAGEVDFAAVGVLLAKTALAVAGAAVLQWLTGELNNRVTYRVVQDIRAEAFRKLQSLPLSYLDSQPHGEIISRMIADVEQFADGLLMGFSQLFTGVITILGTIGFMFAIRWQIALVVVVLTPLSLLVARFIATRTYSLFHRQSQTRAEQTGLIEEMIGNQKTVQAFCHEQEALEQFDEINDRLEDCSARATFFSSLTNPSTRFINALVYAAVGLAGALTCIATAGTVNPFTVGQLSCFLSYANQYTKPFNEISGVIAELQNALACAQRVFELMEQPPQSSDTDNSNLPPVKGNVSLQDVCFSYTPEKKLIEHLNLQVHAGQHIAIVGPTGCGKTTLINLLMRFYDVDQGVIAVEGEDIRTVKRSSLRRSYGMVLQQTWLKTGTVRENILLGSENATEEQMLAAAKAAHADSFIRRLPQGYDTVIGENGCELSQGQRQLLCIARVMLCLPPMLILDEATSSIDTRTELRIQRAFDRMMEGRTSFVVAHRLSTIRQADVILVMRDGRVVEQGSHEALLQKNGFYAQLYNSQFAP